MSYKFYIISILIFIFISQSYVYAAKPDFILNWASDTYIPPFYTGKALPITDSFIKVTAIPTSSINTKILRFEWFLDGRLASNASGEGKADYIFKSSKGGGSYYEIKLRVLYPDAKLLTQKIILIKVAKPEIIIQNTENTDALPSSINNNESNFYLAPNRNTNFIAQPLFFNITNINGLNFIWKFNDQTFEDPNKTDQNIFNMVTSAINSITEKTLNVTVINKNKSFEKTSANLNLVFTPAIE